MDGISVVICCYNSAKRIEGTLSHLFQQQNIEVDKWEIIIVDNGSTDNTNKAALDYYDNYGGIKPLFTIVEEKKIGLSNARTKGIAVSKFDYIIFCDDDNWLSTEYLYNAFLIMKFDKKIGVMGGMGEPVFEAEEPPYFWKNQFHLLAVGPQSNDNNNLLEPVKVVYGAGMVLNKHVFNELIDKYNFSFQTSDRKGNSLFTGGDHELCIAVGRIGYKIFWSKKLRFKHYIPSSRTTLQYYKKLLTGLGLSTPAVMIYSFNRNNYNNYKNDYKYILMRHLKNIIVKYIILLSGGYFFSKNKYKYITELQGLYSNYGAFIMTLKVRNHLKKQFIKSKLFLAGG